MNAGSFLLNPMPIGNGMSALAMQYSGILRDDLEIGILLSEEDRQRRVEWTNVGAPGEDILDRRLTSRRLDDAVDRRLRVLLADPFFGAGSGEGHNRDVATIEILEAVDLGVVFLGNVASSGLGVIDEVDDLPCALAWRTSGPRSDRTCRTEDPR